MYKMETIISLANTNDIWDDLYENNEINAAKSLKIAFKKWVWENSSVVKHFLGKHGDLNSNPQNLVSQG